MILDITFVDGGPVQYQHVRRTAVYCQPVLDAAPDSAVNIEPVLVIHFADNLYPVMHINLRRINCLTVTND
jgi:hypothetical protein